jgi:hypothetical protein
VKYSLYMKAIYKSLLCVKTFVIYILYMKVIPIILLLDIMKSTMRQ